VKLARELKVDVLLLDFAMTRNSGLGVLRDIASLGKRVGVVVLAAEIDGAQTARVLELGAHALVLKEYATEDLIQSIHTVMAGRYWVRHESIVVLVQALQHLQSSTKEDKRREEFGLTPRELEIVAMVVAAYRNKDIAEKFSITENTVKCHVTHIFNKLGASNRLELALFAIHHHWVSGR
jgi:two-component system, NarL family, nitrate/nitrite response regulator NarL